MMKSTILTELPIVPEEYETENLDNVDWLKIHSLMSPQQRALVNGLIRYYHPEHILELGVYRGGGTINILNAIKDRPESTLTSIDLAENFGTDIQVGDDAKQLFSDLPRDKWKLYTGKDPSEIMDFLGKYFDFVIIDTRHLHPIESLNFLCALPYLKDGAVVILHDTELYINERTPGRFLAPRILFSSVVSPKIELRNIGVFQITSDTKKYIGNIFDALHLPWETYPYNTIFSVRKFLVKHYPTTMLSKFDKAAKLNEIYCFSQSLTYSINTIQNFCNRIPADTIFYGAGRNMVGILCTFESIGIPFNFPIWDKSSVIKEINGHSVTVPDFKTQASEGSTVIITVSDEDIFNEVRVLLEPLGYTVFHRLYGVFKYLKQQGKLT